MKPIRLLYILFFITYVQATAQEQRKMPKFKTEKDSAYLADYSKLKNLYLKQLDSESYTHYIKLLKAFMKRAHYKGTFTSPEAMVSWAKENIEKTEFFSATQAEFDWNAIMYAQDLQIKKNKEYYNTISSMVMKYGPQFMIDMHKAILNEYPEKFGLPPGYKMG